MKTNNKKIRFVSALVTLGTLVPLATVATSCATTAQCTTTETSTETSNDTTITPKQPENGIYITVTFNGNGGSLEGQTVIKTRTGKLFGQIAHPKAIREGWRFDGWFNAATGGQAILDSTPLTSEDGTFPIYAQWTQEAASKTLTFAAGDTGGTLYGDTTVEITNETGVTFADINKPRAVLANRDFKCWKYDGNEITDETEITYETFEGVDAPVITPVFHDPKIYGIEIVDKGGNVVEGIEYVGAGLPRQYTSDLDVVVHGQIPTEDFDQSKITWSVSQGGSIAVNSSGVISTVAGNTNKAEITASYTNTDGRTITATKEISAVDPQIAFPEKIVVQDSEGYWFGDFDSLCDPEELGVNNPIHLEYASNETTTADKDIPRDEFDANIVVGTEDGIVPDGFLDGCTDFNSQVVFQENVTNIGDGFMVNCKAFNDTGFEFPSNIQYIGKFFMYDCDAFEQITLPSSLKYVGDSFMALCDSFDSLTVNCDPIYIMSVYEVDTLANFRKEDKDPVSINVSGEYANDFKAKFQEIHSETTGDLIRYYA